MWWKREVQKPLFFASLGTLGSWTSSFWRLASVRAPFKDVHANCFCASLLRTEIHTPSPALERAINNEINNDRADGRYCYSFAWFYDPWRLVISFFFWWIIFYTVCYVLAKKKEENLSPRSLSFLFFKMDHRIPFVLALRSPVRRFQMSLEGLSFGKTLLTIRNIYATDPCTYKI